MTRLAQVLTVVASILAAALIVTVWQLVLTFRAGDDMQAQIVSANDEIARLKNELSAGTAARQREPADPPHVFPSAGHRSGGEHQDAVDHSPSAVDVHEGKTTEPFNASTAASIERFDVAMDREFDRLDRREASSADASEVTTIQKLKSELELLDSLYRKADNTTEPDELVAVRQQMQQTMGNIISLSRADRDERISSLATQIGYTDPAAVKQFVQEVDRIYRETHMDWTKLFNRAPPPTALPAGIPGDPTAITVSPGMP